MPHLILIMDTITPISSKSFSCEFSRIHQVDFLWAHLCGTFIFCDCFAEHNENLDYKWTGTQRENGSAAAAHCSSWREKHPFTWGCSRRSADERKLYEESILVELLLFSPIYSSWRVISNMVFLAKKPKSQKQLLICVQINRTWSSNQL